MRDTTRRRRWLKRISVLPTLLTLGNLVCGFLAIVLVLEAGKHLPLALTMSHAAHEHRGRGAAPEVGR